MPSTIEEYLEGIPDASREALEELRRTIKAAAPELEEGFAWGMPVFKYKGKSMVGFAAFKQHCSFFPMSAKVMEDHAGELNRYDISKGTIRFKPENPLPPALVKKLVKARVKESRTGNRG